MRLAFANVAGGRLVDANNRYVAADRTADFATALAALRPDVLIVTELDCDRAPITAWSAAGSARGSGRSVRSG
ncbi:hypothetical protein ACGFIF_24580 [Kribbella sp. NPDC049174]|uniref:hypothetical protein n=1 Tax=Kribbella sp. NPDC049174 TaxID=3364112 RepID=UPI0037201E24